MSNDEKTILDLAKYRSEGVRVLSGRDRGKAVRDAAHVEELDAQDREVLVVIPDDTFAITSSFFLGLFGNSISKLGEDEFRRRYSFQGPGSAIIDDSIRYAAKVVNPLGEE